MFSLPSMSVSHVRRDTPHPTRNSAECLACEAALVGGEGGGRAAFPARHLYFPWSLSPACCQEPGLKKEPSDMIKSLDPVPMLCCAVGLCVSLTKMGLKL